jgi:hypothetical protein
MLIERQRLIDDHMCKVFERYCYYYWSEMQYGNVLSIVVIQRTQLILEMNKILILLNGQKKNSLEFSLLHIAVSICSHFKLSSLISYITMLHIQIDRSPLFQSTRIY